MGFGAVLEFPLSIVTNFTKNFPLLQGNDSFNQRIQAETQQVI